MDKFHTYEVHSKLMKQDLYEITVTSNGTLIDASHWVSLLLSTHVETYFGTMLLEENKPGATSLYLNGWQTVTLFASEQFHPYVEWIWDESCDFMFAISLPIYDAILSKEWQLDFTQTAQTFAWELPSSVTEEFHDEFWEELIDGQNAKELATTLFNDALNFYLSSQTYTASTIGARLENLRQSPITKEQLQTYFDEKRWLEFIQGEDLGIPFTMGIRLVEPSEIHESWELQLFLRDSLKKEQTFDYSKNRDLPDEYAGYESVISEELARWERLFPWLVHKNFLTSTLTEVEAWKFLSEVSQILLALDVEILLPSWWYQMKQAKFKIRAQVNSSNQTSMVGMAALNDFKWRISINQLEMSEEEFQALVDAKRPFLQIGKRWVALDKEMIKQIQTYIKKAEQQGQHIRSIIEQELQLSDSISDEFDALQVEYELNNYWRDIFHQLRHLNDLQVLPTPKTFRGELREYQQFGFSWLAFLRQFSFGGILADDMGLGKTVQLISYLCHVKETEKPTIPALIICPTSVLGNWQKELEKFAPTLKVHLHYGQNRKKGEALKELLPSYDVILTSYGLLGLDVDDFSPIPWSSITIDEAQTIKNVGTKQSRAVRSLRGKHHIALSGTPMENRLMELWAIFDFVNRFYLGSIHQFTQKYVLPIEKNQEEKAVKNLQTLIRPFLLRRTKKDESIALNLPEKLEQKEYCSLTVEQATLYEQLVLDTMKMIEEASSFERVGLVLKMLTKLKQICNHPSLYLKEAVYEDIESRSTKIEKVRSILVEMDLNEESCIIFTQYIEMGAILQQFLKEAFGIDAPFLNGSTPKADRDQLIEDFQAKKFPVFILSLKAGGTGLNLTAANHVIHYDRWWNPAVENQATDRAYRIGQKRFVHVHKFISTGTLEEKIDAMLEKKQHLNDSIIASDQWMTNLSIDELKELVSLG